MAIENFDQVTIEAAKLRPFSKFIMSIGELPTSYLDSLSYAEQVTWFCDYLQNNVIPTVNNNADGLQELQNYFTNLDLQEEVNNKIDEMAQDGSLTNIIKRYIDPLYEAYEQVINEQINNQDNKIEEIENNVNSSLNVMNNKINNITSGTPKGVYATVAALESDDPSHDYVYLVSSDGYWYYYDDTNSEWTQGALYQATGIEDKSITYNKFKETTILSENIFDNNIYFNGYIGADGTVHNNATSTSGLNIYTDYLEIDPNKTQKVIANYKANFIFYNSSKVYISGTSMVNKVAQTIPENTKYIRASLISDNILDQGIFQAGYIPMDTKFRYKIDKLITDTDLLFDNNKLDNDILKSYNVLSDNKFDPTKIQSGMLASTGDISDSTATFSDPFISEFYPCEGGASYYFGSSSGAVYIGWYDANKEFIERISTGNAVVTSPSTARYLKICSNKTKIHNIRFIKSTSKIYLPFNFTIENLKIGRTRPTTELDTINEKSIDYDYILGCINYDDYIIKSRNEYYEHIVTLNENKNNANNTDLVICMQNKNKVLEIEFDCKVDNTNNGKSYVLISNYNTSGFSDNIISTEARSFELKNTTWEHKKVRYMIPPWLPIVKIIFRSTADSTLNLKNINIKFLDRASNTENPILKFVGHKGMPYLAPSNTIAGFEYAIAAGMEACVINVNYTSDGKIVCLHDNTIDATSTGTGNIHDMTYAEANEYDFGYKLNAYYTGTKLPLLSEVLELFAKSGIKPIIRWNNAIIEDNKANLMAMLSKNGIKENVTILGFDLPVLLPLKQEYPDFRYAYCGYDTVNQTLINNLKTLGDNTVYDCEYQYLTSDIVKLMHENNIKVCTWFVNNQTQLANAYAMGVDYIKSDYYALQNCNI